MFTCGSFLILLLVSFLLMNAMDSHDRRQSLICHHNGTLNWMTTDSNDYGFTHILYDR